MDTNKEHYLTEAPHVSRITCPHCGQRFLVDLKVEDWKNLTNEEIARYMIDYNVYLKLPFNCPNDSCKSELIHDSKFNKTDYYNKIINKLPAYEQAFINNIKEEMKHQQSLYVLEENLTFKKFSKMLDIL